MPESFQGRYRLREQLPAAGELPRVALEGVALDQPAQGILVAGARAWDGLVEQAWTRAHRCGVTPALAAAFPLAVEQHGDEMLIVHPALPRGSWAAQRRDWPSARLAQAVGELLSWWLASRAAAPGCGNLRLSTVHDGPDGLLVSPAAYALPPLWLAGRGLFPALGQPFLPLGAAAEPDLDAWLLAHDLAGFLESRLAAAGDEAAAKEAAPRLRELAACLAAVPLAAGSGGAAAVLTALAKAAAEGAAALPAARARPERSAPKDDLTAALGRLATSRQGGLLLVPGGAMRAGELRARLASAAPADEDVVHACGLLCEPLRPPPRKPGRRPRPGWLLVEESVSAPAVGAVRWLITEPENAPRRVILVTRADEGLADRLFRSDLEQRWGLRPLSDPLRRPAAAGEEVAAGAAAPGPSDGIEPEVVSGADLQPAARLPLGLLAVSGGVLPLSWLRAAMGTTAREFGAIIADLEARRWLRLTLSRASGPAAGWNCVACLAPEAADRVSLDPPRKRAYARLLLHQVAADRRSRKPELPWLRCRLWLAAGEPVRGIEELDRLLGCSAGPESDYLTASATLEALRGGTRSSSSTATLISASHRLGRDCLARGLIEESLPIFARALELMPPAHERVASATEAAEVVAIVIAMADVLEKRGDFPALFALLQRTVTVYAPLVPLGARAKLQFELAWAHHRLGRHEAALEICRALLKQVDADAYPAETADVHNLIGLIAFESSRYEEARLNIQKGLVLRERIGDQAAIARSCNNLGMVHLSLGDLGRAEAFLTRSLAIKNAAEDRYGVAGCLLNLAYIALAQGQIQMAQERGHQALASGREHGFQQLCAESLQLLGEVAEAQARPQDASGLYVEARELAARIGDDDQLLIALRHLAALSLRQGDLEAARGFFAGAEAILPRIPSRLQRALLRELAGDLHSRQDEHEAAAAAYEEAAAALVELRQFDRAARAHARAALALARDGRRLEAEALYEQLRARSADPHLGEPPPEFGELARLLGGEHGDDLATPPGDPVLLRCLLALPALEARAADISDLAGAIVDLLQRTDPIAGVTLTLLSPTGEELGRWPRRAGAEAMPRASQAPPALFSAGAEVGAAGPALRARRELADGRAWSLRVGLRERPGSQELDQAIERRRQEIVRRVLALALAVLAARPDRLTAAPGPTATAPTPAGAGGSSSSAAVTPLIGVSEAASELRRMIAKVAELDTHVLILGENGSGKDVVARLIHACGPRRAAPYIAVNCASIPSALLESTLFGHEKGAFTDAVARRTGEFELAGEGTILLDEIGDMPLELQGKLLRVLQEREFRRVGGGETIRLRARVLAATNREIEKAVVAGGFRADLYYRLAVIPLVVPPLRERPADIPVLLRHFLDRYAAEFGVPACQLAPGAIEALVSASWPGNVRELENLAKRLLIFHEGSVIRREDLPAALPQAAQGSAERDSLDDLAARIVRSRDYSMAEPLLPRLQVMIAQHLLSSLGNKTRAAKLLGITTPTLYEWLRRERDGAPPPPWERRASG